MHDALTIHHQPELAGARMVVGFSGWMDGGQVSTGTIGYLAEVLDAEPLADIAPSDFYILNVPGSMEISALFRPHTRIENGVIEDFDLPVNTFKVSESHNLILFEGKEPNLCWSDFADCIFQIADDHEVSMLAFVGSVSSMVPHTREPRFHSAISTEDLRSEIERLGLNPANYEGPASFSTYLSVRARERGLPMASVVAEVPGYIQGRNIKGIDAVVRKLADLLDLSFDMEPLAELRREFESRLSEVMDKRPEIVKHIRKLEDDYDKEVVSAQEDDLREWFEKQGIELN